MTENWFVVYDAATKIILLGAITILSVYILLYLKKEVQKQKKEMEYLKNYTVDLKDYATDLKDLHNLINKKDKELLKFQSKLLDKIQNKEIDKSTAFDLLFSRTNENLEFRLHEIYNYLISDKIGNYDRFRN